MPHSEQNSADNSDMESSCSYPVSGRMPILPTPPGPPASSNNSISSTPKVSYADIAKMGSVAVTTPPVVVSGTGGSMSNIKGPSPTNITLNSSDGVKDANNNISTSSIAGSTENSPKNVSTVDSGLSLQTNLSPSSNSCSPYPGSSPICISPSSSSTSPSNQTKTLPETSKASKDHHNATTANNQIKSSSSTESTLDAKTLSKDPPTITSEINFDQEISSKDGKSIGTSSANSSSQMLFAAVAIRPKDFDTFRETKMENRKVICEDNSTNSTKQTKNDKKMEKTTIQLSSFSSSTTPSSSSSITTTSTSSTVSPQQTSTASTGSSAATNSKTLEALLSPPVEKTPTFDTKKENINKLNARIASIKSDMPSRASMLKKSNSIPGANGKDNSCYRVNITESNDSSKSLTNNKIPRSLPPVIMNEDSDGTDEIESTFTFGFFDVTSSSSSSSSLKNSSSSSSIIKQTSSSSSTKPSTTATTTTPTTPSPSASTTINKPAASVMMTSKSSSKPSSVKNNFDKTANNSNNSNSNSSSSASRVKSTKNASNCSNLTHPIVTSSTTTSTATMRSTSTSNNSVKPDQSRSSSSEAATDLPSAKKNSSKDSKSTSGNGNNNTSLDKFMAIKLAQPSTNMDADINTFNYNQIINFIKTAWESVMCQYHRTPAKNNSHSSSSAMQTSSTKGADLFCERTIYYECEICEN